MKKIVSLSVLLLAVVLLLASCGSPKLEGSWTVTGGKTEDGTSKDVSGLLGEHEVVLTFDKDHFTMVVEGDYTKQYAYQYKDGKITFADQDEYISFNGYYNVSEVTFNLKIDGDRMTWTLPGSRTVEFSRVK